jgi:hypothetical protein
VLARNGIADGIVYLQVTRGVARRDHPFPTRAEPALVVTAARKRPPSRGLVEQGVAVISVPDIRWKRCDIKSVSLLPNVLAKQQARESGAHEAWLIDEAGYVTEGSSTKLKVRLAGGRVGWIPTARVTSRNVWGEVASCESGGNPRTNTGNGYYGLYQFTASTWRSVGGTSLPHRNPAAEQTKWAQILQGRAGWGQWPSCTRQLGLR